jgi:transcriptional regulator with XRE-family HTH domain
MTFGSRLMQIRESQNLSIKDLSRSTGLLMSHLQYLEQQDEPPGTATLEKLAAGLGLRPKDLLDE